MSNAAQEMQSLIEDLRANAELFRQKIRDYDTLLAQFPELNLRLSALEDEAPDAEGSPERLLTQVAERFTDLESRIASLADATALDLFREDLSQLKARIALFGVSLTKLEHQISGETRAYKDGQAKLATEVHQIHLRLDRVQAEVDYQRTSRRERPRWFFPLAAAVVLCLSLATIALLRTHKLEDALALIPVAEETPVAPSPVTPSPQPEPTAAPAENTPTTPLRPPERTEAIIAARARYALTYLQRQNMSRLAQKYIHPSLGVQFLPQGFRYPGIQLDTEAAETSLSAAARIPWGMRDNSGQALEGSFRDFFTQYIYNQDFIEANTVFYNELPKLGPDQLHTSDIARKFPGAIFAAYSMDKHTLILVFSELNRGYWYLVSVINTPN